MVIFLYSELKVTNGFLVWWLSRLVLEDTRDPGSIPAEGCCKSLNYSPFAVLHHHLASHIAQNMKLIVFGSIINTQMQSFKP